MTQHNPRILRHVFNAPQRSLQSAAGIARNIFLTSSGSRIVFCSFTRTPARVNVNLTERASSLSRSRAMYPPRTNRATAMLIADRPTPMCSANFDSVVGRVACK